MNSYLQSIKINNVSTIYSKTFSNTSPKKIELNDVESIGSNAFYGCPYITNVTLPDSLKEIGEMAFMNCPNLEYVILNKDIERIYENIFRGNTNVIYYKGTEEDFENITIYDDSLFDFDIYFYSEAEKGDFWHFDESGNPTVNS